MVEDGKFHEFGEFREFLKVELYRNLRIDGKLLEITKQSLIIFKRFCKPKVNHMVHIA